MQIFVIAEKRSETVCVQTWRNIRGCCPYIGYGSNDSDGVKCCTGQNGRTQKEQRTQGSCLASIKSLAITVSYVAEASFEMKKGLPHTNQKRCFWIGLSGGVYIVAAMVEMLPTRLTPKTTP